MRLLIGAFCYNGWYIELHKNPESNTIGKGGYTVSHEHRKHGLGILNYTHLTEAMVKFEELIKKAIND